MDVIHFFKGFFGSKDDMDDACSDKEGKREAHEIIAGLRKKTDRRVDL